MREEVSDGRKNIYREELIPTFADGPHSRLSKFVRLLFVVHFFNSNLFWISTCGLNNLRSIKLTKSGPTDYLLTYHYYCLITGILGRHSAKPLTP